MSFPLSAPPSEPQSRGHFYWALKGTLSLGFNRTVEAPVGRALGERVIRSRNSTDSLNQRCRRSDPRIRKGFEAVRGVGPMGRGPLWDTSKQAAAVSGRKQHDPMDSMGTTRWTRWGQAPDPMRPGSVNTLGNQPPAQPPQYKALLGTVEAALPLSYSQSRSHQRRRVRLLPRTATTPLAACLTIGVHFKGSPLIPLYRAMRRADGGAGRPGCRCP